MVGFGVEGHISSHVLSNIAIDISIFHLGILFTWHAHLGSAPWPANDIVGGSKCALPVVIDCIRNFGGHQIRRRLHASASVRMTSGEG